MTALVLFIFSGRKENMEVQRPYLDRLLTMYPEAELHLWDLTRNRADGEYLRTREGEHDGRVKVMRQLRGDPRMRCRYPNGYPNGKRPRGWAPCTCIVHKPPYEKPYQWYAKNGEDGTVYVKLDDDVLFLETDHFADLISGLDAHPDRVYSANVVNNAVCAKYDPDFSEMFAAVGDPEQAYADKAWWALHIEPLFARMCHNHFLAYAYSMWSQPGPKPFRTRTGEAISINCIAFTHQTMCALSEAFKTNDRLGDEGAVDALLPWIVPTFRAAHLSFGMQEKSMSPIELTEIRTRYAFLSQEYLNSTLTIPLNKFTPTLEIQ